VQELDLAARLPRPGRTELAETDHFRGAKVPDGRFHVP